MRLLWLIIILALIWTPVVQASDAADCGDDTTLGDCMSLVGTAEIAQISEPSNLLQQDTFTPLMTKIGFMTPNSTGAQGDQIEWIITVRNTSGTAGQNITITDDLQTAFRVDRVESSLGDVNVDGQLVTVTIPTLAPDEVASIRIITTIVEDNVIFDNTACIVAQNISEICASGQAISQLPATGETPLSRLLFELVTGLALIFAGLTLTLYAAATLVEKRPS